MTFRFELNDGKYFECEAESLLEADKVFKLHFGYWHNKIKEEDDRIHILPSTG